MITYHYIFVKKFIFIIILTAYLTSPSYSLELLPPNDKIRLNRVFMDIDSDHIYIPSTSNRHIVIYNRTGEYKKVITLDVNIHGRFNYFKKVSNGFLLYYMNELIKFNDQGSFVQKKKFPKGCIPTYMGVYLDFVTITLPKQFDKNNETIVLDINNLSTIGTLQKINHTPTVITKNGVVPYRIHYNNSNYFFIGGNNDLFWVNYESDKIIKTNNDLVILKSIELKSKSTGYKTYTLINNKIYYLDKNNTNITLKNIDGDF